MLRSRIRSFRYAFQGLGVLFTSQPNAVIHALAASTVLCLAGYCQVTKGEWIALVLCIGSVLAAEAFNTALEYLTDLVSPTYHPLAGRVKDLAAAGVLLCALCSAVVGGVIFVPYLMA